MAIFFHTNSAGTLLKEFGTQIAQPEKSGKVITWAINSDNFYTHKSTQWGEKAWLKARVEAHQLTFNIIKPKNGNVSSPVYAYYHGHLIETFLSHFDKLFAYCSATALADIGDVIKSS
jgi:hypothetical protein